MLYILHNSDNPDTCNPKSVRVDTRALVDEDWCIFDDRDSTKEFVNRMVTWLEMLYNVIKL